MSAVDKQVKYIKNLYMPIMFYFDTVLCANVIKVHYSEKPPKKKKNFHFRL